MTATPLLCRTRVDPPTCPRCGATADVFPGKFGIRASHCGLWSWGGKPLVDVETHQARIAAHYAFDKLWQPPNGRMTRAEAYMGLARQMGISRSECHIALMTKEQARSVVPIVLNWKEQA